MSELSAVLLSQSLLENDGRIFVAYSGGVDSQVLLHLCASTTRYKDRVTAVYVHHGLQVEADAWAVHCRYSAEELGVAFKELRVEAKAKARQSPEEAARIARYSALKTLLHPGDVMLLAQHREDQLETVLLQLFRGAGIAGLAAMPASMPFGNGTLSRPFLDVGKEAILRYAAEHRLEWVEDPSNRCSDFDRNYLRNEILPLLKQRWPSLDVTVSRSARHCASASALLDEVADQLLVRCRDDDGSLKIDALIGLTENRRRLLLRRWLVSQGLNPPSEVVVNTLIDEVVGAAQDASPELSIQHHSIRRFDQRLYCFEPRPSPKQAIQSWPEGIRRLRREQGDCLQLRESSSGIPVKLWQKSTVTVQLRRGGEKIKLPGRQGTHALKKLFQEAAIPPWRRESIPLIYFDDRLAAVADLWVAEDYFSAAGELCYQIVWQQAE